MAALVTEAQVGVEPTLASFAGCPLSARYRAVEHPEGVEPPLNPGS